MCYTIKFEIHIHNFVHNGIHMHSFTYACMYVCVLLLCTTTTIDAPVITPSLAVLFPGSEVIFSCVNATSVVAWSINGNILLNFPPGVSVANGTALRVTISANATTYGCVDVIGPGNIIPSNNATLVLPG